MTDVFFIVNGGGQQHKIWCLCKICYYPRSRKTDAINQLTSILRDLIWSLFTRHILACSFSLFLIIQHLPTTDPPPIIPLCICIFLIAQLTIGSVLKVSKLLVILLWNNWSKRHVGKTPNSFLSLFSLSRVPVLWFIPQYRAHMVHDDGWAVIAPIVRINPLHLHTQTTRSTSLGLCPLSQRLPHLPATFYWNISSKYHVYHQYKLYVYVNEHQDDDKESFIRWKTYTLTGNLSTMKQRGDIM